MADVPGPPMGLARIFARILRFSAIMAQKEESNQVSKK
jgi:hypothetical protein